MDRPSREVFERLAPVGLGRALDDLFDQNQLVQLANACGVKYRGMRTQTQSRQRLLADLVEQAERQEVARRAIQRALEKATSEAAREWGGLPSAEKARRLCDESFLRSDGNLGLHLYLLASVEDPELGAAAQQLAQRLLGQIAASGPAAAETGPAEASREETRLKRRVHELERKLKHLESQLLKSREAEKTFKRDLIQRKGELAESRMLVERLRHELAGAQAAAQAAATPRPEPQSRDEVVAGLSKAVRQLAAEQKKLAHAFERQSAAPAAGGVALAPVLDGLERLAGALAGARADQLKEHGAQTKRLEELRADVRARTIGGMRAVGSKRSRAGQPQRVGVFIDVQNMYYAARQLKGKLDFDALLEAAVNGRRLIQATAYVVESKETDQSQFISVLQQRAIEVRRKVLTVRSDGSMKGDWDMELALDVLDAAPQLDVVVLVSGDGDFTSLVKRVKAMGPRVEVIAFPRNTAKALAEAADQFQPLDRKFMIYPKRARPSGGSASSDPREGRVAPQITDEPAPAELAASAPEALTRESRTQAG